LAGALTNALVVVKNAVFIVFIVEIKAFIEEAIGNVDAAAKPPPAETMRLKLSVHCAHAPEGASSPNASAPIPPAAPRRSRKVPVVSRSNAFMTNAPHA